MGFDSKENYTKAIAEAYDYKELDVLLCGYPKYCQAKQISGNLSTLMTMCVDYARHLIPSSRRGFEKELMLAIKYMLNSKNPQDAFKVLRIYCVLAKMESEAEDDDKFVFKAFNRDLKQLLKKNANMLQDKLTDHFIMVGNKKIALWDRFVALNNQLPEHAKIRYNSIF